MKQFTTTLISLFLILNFINAQELVDQTHGINITASATGKYKPDLFKVSVIISEFESTDPITQETTRIEIEKIEETIYKKLKELNITQVKLENIYMTPGVQNYNYNNSQRKLLKKEVSFNWSNENELELLFKKLLLKGIDNIIIKSNYSESLENEIRKELSEKAIKNAKKEASEISKLLKLELGDVISFNENSSITPSTLQNNQTYANYNGYYYSTNKIGEQDFFTTVNLTFKTK